MHADGHGLIADAWLYNSRHEAADRYTKASDGVSIPYSVMGSGVPFVFAFPISHQVLLLESPDWQPWFEGLAARYQLVVYDSRGNGLSQRDLPVTTEALALDLEAVVDHLSAKDLFAFAFADRGEFVAKGFEEPTRVYEVSWRS